MIKILAFIISIIISLMGFSDKTADLFAKFKMQWEAAKILLNDSDGSGSGEVNEYEVYEDDNNLVIIVPEGQSVGGFEDDE